MPTVDEELAAIRARGRARKVQKERDAATSRPLSGDPAVRAQVGAASARAKAEGVSKEALPAAPDPGLLSSFQQTTGDIQRTFADRLTRGGMDYAVTGADKAIRSLLGSEGGTTIEEEQKKTQGAAERAGKTGEAFGIVGDIAPAAVLPAGAVAGPIRAALAGGAFAGADTTLNSLFRLGEAPSMREVGTSVALGTAAGPLGYYVGKGLADKYIKLVGADKPLHRQTQQSLKETIEAQNHAASMMRDAEVRLSRSSVRGLARRLERNFLNNREFSVVFRLKDGAPATRQALARIKELTDIEARPSFDDVNELRKFIRDSAKNDAGEIIIGKRDADMIKEIDKGIKTYLEGIGTAPQGHVVSGNVKQALQGFNEMNALTQDKNKQNIVSALLERAHWSETAGISYDKAVQQQFKTFVQPSISGRRNPLRFNFNDEEWALLEEAAEGGFTTKILNRLDNSFGHGLLADLHRTYAIATRKAMKPGAQREAGKVFEGVSGRLPAAPAMQTGLGARAGIAATTQDDALTQSLPQPLSP